MRKAQKIIYYLVFLMTFNSSCQDPNPYGKSQKGNAKIVKTQIFDENKFYPEKSILTDSCLFVIGNNGFDKDETILFSIGQSCREIDRIKHAELNMIGFKENVFVYGRIKKYDATIKNPVSWPTDKLILGKVRSKQVDYNSNYAKSISSLIDGKGLLIGVENENTDGWPMLVSSSDNGTTWKQIEFFHQFNAKEPWFINDSIIYVYGSNKGFRPENYSIFKYDIKNNLLIEEIPITKLKGGFPTFKIFNNQPSVETRLGNRIFIYNLLELDNNPEVIYTPKGRYVGDVFISDGLLVIVTTPEEERHSNSRYQIYSKKADQKDWVLDFEAPHFVAYDFWKNELIGFDINHNLIRIKY